jgi:acyl-CoA thioester hydrolase
VGNGGRQSVEASERKSRGNYARFQSITTRWIDSDAYGHLNNVVYYSFFDTAVNALLIEHGLLDPVSSPQICLVVETGCRYFESLSFPENVDVGIRVERLGNSSVQYDLGIFRHGQDRTLAEGRFVHVCVDRSTRRPVSLPENYRTLLSSLEGCPE